MGFSESDEEFYSLLHLFNVFDRSVCTHIALDTFRRMRKEAVAYALSFHACRKDDARAESTGGLILENNCSKSVDSCLVVSARQRQLNNLTTHRMSIKYQYQLPR